GPWPVSTSSWPPSSGSSNRSTRRLSGPGARLPVQALRRRAQAVDLVARELPPRAGPKAAEGEAGVRAAVQPPYRVADRLAHALDLVLAPLVERELDPRGAHASGSRACGASVVELDSFGQGLYGVVSRLALDVGHVDLVDLVARVGKP